MDAVKKGHDELFTYTARNFEANCRLAGLKKLAERVRPSTKRPGRIVGAPDDGGSPGDGANDSEKAPDQAEPDSEVSASTEIESGAQESASV